jgi:hypothetical protein
MPLNQFQNQCCTNKQCPNFFYENRYYLADKNLTITPTITGDTPYHFEITPAPRGGVSINKNTGVITVTPGATDFDLRDYKVTMKSPFCNTVSRFVGLTIESCAFDTPTNLSYILKEPCETTEIDLNYKKILIKLDNFDVSVPSGLYDTNITSKKLWNVNPHFEERLNGYDYELVVEVTADASNVINKRAKYSYTAGDNVLPMTDSSGATNTASWNMNYNLNETNIPGASYVGDEFDIVIDNNGIPFTVSHTLALYQYVPVSYTTVSCDGASGQAYETLEQSYIEPLQGFDDWIDNNIITLNYNRRRNNPTNVFSGYFSEYSGGWESFAIGGQNSSIGGIFPTFFFEQSGYAVGCFNLMVLGTVPGNTGELIYTPLYGSIPIPNGTYTNGVGQNIYGIPGSDSYVIQPTNFSDPTNIAGRMLFKVPYNIPGAIPECKCPDTLSVGDTISISPTVTGSGLTYTVTPALPSGLTLNPSTGVISGKPNTITSLTTYTITATNCKGSTSFDLIFRVV